MWLTARSQVRKQGLDARVADRSAWAVSPYEPFISRGPSYRRQVALTFDDGPHATYTPQLLALLRQHHAQATFLVVGQQARANPHLIRQEIADGHCVGNHTYHHVNLTTLKQPDLATELVACGNVILKITGHRPHLFRPPGGQCSREVLRTARSLGYTTVWWTDNTHDYLNPGIPELETRVLRGLGNGEILLFHDGARQTLELLPRILDYLDAHHIACVTVDHMLRQMTPGSRWVPLPAGHGAAHSSRQRTSGAALAS